MAAVVQGVVNHGLDTNVLFEKYTIDEIREIEKKTRSDIERKKEELRIMVGERYRDLIEAADTITEMKHSSENVMQSIGRMQELSQKMKQDQMVKGFNMVTKARPDMQQCKETQFYGIAVQIKLLLDMPEKIWSALDSRAYLRATQMYLLAWHVHSGLQAGPGAYTARLLSCLPVLARTWSTISHFREVILQGCRSMLKEQTISDDETAECLCSLLLLEDSTPRQVFNDFLILSTTAVQSLFTANQSNMSIKDQVCAVVHMIVRTIHQIYAVFSSSPDTSKSNVRSNLLMTTLSRVTDKGKSVSILSDTSGTSSMKFLPVAVQEFRPVLRNHASPIQDQNLQENCQQWVKSCMQTVSLGLEQLLGYVSTVRGLAAIRSKAWEQLANDSRMDTWNLVCTTTLRRHINIWEDFFQKHFLQRTKILIKAHYESALVSCKQQVTHILSDQYTTDKSSTIEHDVSGYVWVESPTDMPTNMAWVPVGHKTLTDAGTLSMKAKAYTPTVQSLCRNFDNKLRTLVEDAGHFQSPGIVETKGPFDLFADTVIVLEFQQECCKDCIKKLMEFLQNQLSVCSQQLNSSPDKAANHLILDRILLLGRFSGSLCDLSAHLQQCMMGILPKAETARITKRPSSSKGTAKATEDAQWVAVKDELQSFSNHAFWIWAEYTADQTASLYRQALLDKHGHALLHASTRWGEIQIEEETEDGKTMTSRIRVPMQTSIYVTSLLYQLCEQINWVGGHTINRNVLTKMVQRLSDSIISSYEEFSRSPQWTTRGVEQSGTLTTSQTQALQLVFDIKILTNLLPRKEDTPENKSYQQKVQKLIEKFESQIDPFDLDVFSPYMNSHIARHTQRCNVLLGSLMSVDRHGAFLGTKPAQMSQQEQHNLLTLSTLQNRLPLLPLSVQHRPSMAPPIMQPPKPKSQTETTEEPPAVAIPRNESSGFLANMSTLWFSNVSKK